MLSAGVAAGVAFAAGASDFFEHAQALEDGKSPREKRLADVEARETLPFEEDDPAAASGEKGRDGRAGGDE